VNASEAMWFSEDIKAGFETLRGGKNVKLERYIVSERAFLATKKKGSGGGCRGMWV